MATSPPKLSRDVSPRLVFHNEMLWWKVREGDSRAVPGALGSACLIFESADVVRRLWIFPSNWWELDDEALWQLGERVAHLNAPQTEALRKDMASAVHRAMELIERAQALLEEAKLTIAENRERRATLRDLLRSCRAERHAMRAAVESHAKKLREAGVTQDDASILIANAVRETVRVSADAPSVQQWERDTARWCALAYSAA